MSDATAAGNTAAPADTEVTRWVKEIDLYEQKAGPWHTRGQKIERRYKDERNNTRESKEKRYNILWSNIQTLLPALYSRNPKPDFQRRFLDADPVGRVTCEILERATSFTLDKEDFYLTARQCVTDRLLPGRGTLWIRYVPHFAEAETQALGTEIANEGLQVDDDAEADQPADRVQQATGDQQPQRASRVPEAKRICRSRERERRPEGRGSARRFQPARRSGERHARSAGENAMIGAFKDRLLMLLAQTQQEAAQKALQAAMQQQQAGAPAMQPPVPPHPPVPAAGAMPAPMPSGAIPH